MLCSIDTLPTKYEQPIRTSANTITFSVCTLQAADACQSHAIHVMSDNVCSSNNRIELSLASYRKPLELQSEDIMPYQVPAHARVWIYSSAGGPRGKAPYF